MPSLPALSRRATAHLVTGAAVVVALTAYHAIGAGALSLGVLVGLSCVTAASLFAGTLLCRLAGLTDEGGVDALEALLVGVLGLSAALMILVFVLPFGLAACFALLMGALALGWWLRARRRRPAPPVTPLGGAGSFALFMALAAAGLWSIENLTGLWVGAESVEVYPWQDLLFHAKAIGVFQHAGGAATLTNYAMAGQGLEPYHYATYLLPALVGTFGDVHSFSLAAGLLPPLGTLCTGLSAYALGKACFGPRAGAVAACGLLFVPDGAFVGLGNAWTGYHFFQQVGLGGMYGVSALALGCACGVRAARSATLGPLVAAVVLLAVSALFKIQLALVYALPLFLVLVAFWPRWRPAWRLGLGAAASGVYVLLLMLMSYVPHAPTLAFSTEGVLVNLRMILDAFEGGAAVWLGGWLTEAPSYARAVAVGAPLVLIATYGLWLLLLPLGLVSLWRRHERGLVFQLPLWLLAVHLVAAFGLDANQGWGDAYEILHKTFVLPYSLVAIIASAALGRWLDDRGALTSPRLAARLARLALCAGALGLCAVFGQRVQSNSSFSVETMRREVPRGLYDAALYLRASTPQQAVAQLDTNDESLVLTAFSERGAYVIHCRVNCGEASPEVQERLASVDELLDRSDLVAVRAEARARGIDYLVVQGRGRPWQTGPEPPAFESGGYFVYAMSRPRAR